ncbi:MAG: COG2426 family protein [Lachnospiraceae bacterium]|jgi:hypothetical protein
MLSLKNYLWVFFLSMVPVLELRAAIPIGATLGLEWVANYLICVIGNMIPVPIILLFVRHVLEWMKKIPRLDKIALWVENKAQKNTPKVQKYASLGLLIFVALPLPGTGAWTGALVAAMLDMRMKYAIPSIFCGVLIAGLIMSLASYGLVSFLTFLA